MKNIIAVLFVFLAVSANAQDKKEKPKTQIVDAACGQCQFAMEGHGCELAVRMDGKSYFVDGTTIHDHGDAHAEKGFCNAISKASVTGEIVNNRFKATSFVLIDDKK